MLKQGLVYVLLSVLCILFATYVHIGMVFLDMIYNKLNLLLATVFSANTMGQMLARTLALMLIPLGLVGVPALIYRSVRRGVMPYFVESLWLVWFIVALSHILAH